MASTRTISVHDAKIKTAAVEIKSLTVSGKQVTMGVFRQLLREDLIDPSSAELAGVPWGTVNYFPKPCEAANHLHVVWQKGTDLRRACVYKTPFNPWRHQTSYGIQLGVHADSDLEELTEVAEAKWETWLKAASLYEGWRPNGHYAGSGPIRFRIRGSQDSGAGNHEVSTALNVPDALSRHWANSYERPMSELASKWAGREPGYPQEVGQEVFKGFVHFTTEGMQQEYGRIARHYEVGKWVPNGLRSDGGFISSETKYRKLTPDDEALFEAARESLESEVVEGVPEDKSVAQLHREAQAAVDEVVAFEQRWERHYREISALDQLFIAV